MVPITADLAGYASFWQRWLVGLTIGSGVFGVVVVVLLVLIWRK